MTLTKVSPLEAYALRRALSRMKQPDGVTVNGWVGLLLSQFDTGDPDDWSKLSAIVNADPDLSRAVLAVDPKAAPPVAQRQTDAPIIPALPSKAALSKEAERMALTAGRWVDKCIAWIHSRAAMSSAMFIEAGAIWAASVVIAGRLRLTFDYESIKPHLYMLLVAPTTYYKKTTTLRAVEDLVRAVAPHLMVASQNSPELLLYKLAGNRTANFDSLSQYDQMVEDAGRQFAAQRAIIADEATRLLSDKNYMSGFVENLMEMFDARKQVERELRSDGKLIIRDSSMSLFGATTPARLSINVGEEQWHDGMFARFALITPTEMHIERQSATVTSELKPPDELRDALRRLYDALPKPPMPDPLNDDGEPPEFPSRNVQITKEALAAYNRYADALHEMCAPDRGLDERVKGNYGRLDKLAIKVAITLAALDWAQEQTPTGVPVIDLGHWARAQQVAERWRESLHRLLFGLSRTEDSRTEMKIMDLLTASPQPLSRRELYVQTGSRNRKNCNDAIDALVDDGLIIEVDRQGARGPATKAYQVSP